MTANRERLKAARFRRQVEFYQGQSHFKAGVCHCFGLTATWDAARRVATMIIGAEVKDVMVAWAILYFIEKLPDGSERLRTAAESALELWERQVAQ